MEIVEKRDRYYAEMIQHEEVGDWNKVLECCLKLCELNLPDLEISIAWINAAKAYGHLKDYDRALNSYDKAIQIENKYSRCSALEQKAAFLAEQNKLEASLAIYRQLVARRDLYLVEIQRFARNIEILERALSAS